MRGFFLHSPPDFHHSAARARWCGARAVRVTPCVEATTKTDQGPKGVWGYPRSCGPGAPTPSRGYTNPHFTPTTPHDSHTPHAHPTGSRPWPAHKRSDRRSHSQSATRFNRVPARELGLLNPSPKLDGGPNPQQPHHTCMRERYETTSGFKEELPPAPTSDL